MGWESLLILLWGHLYVFSTQGPWAVALHPILAVRVGAKRLQKHGSILVLGIHCIQAESLEE